MVYFIVATAVESNITTTSEIMTRLVSSRKRRSSFDYILDTDIEENMILSSKIKEALNKATSTSSSSNNNKDSDEPRSGKWTVEEESYANRLIIDFESGVLADCEEGCTLRSYLAKKLNCAPMRISKKFAGKCIGKVSAKRNFCNFIMTPTLTTSCIPPPLLPLYY